MIAPPIEPANQSYIQDYLIHSQLGSGGQANIYLASRLSIFYALKVYKVKAHYQQHFQDQVTNQSSFDHPHVLHIIAHKIDASIRLQNTEPEIRPLIVLQLGVSDLFNIIKDGGYLRPEVCRVYAKQLISVVQLMGQNNITHRNLKPQSIILDNSFKIQVADFGHSVKTQGIFNDFILTENLGTEGYKAPEIYTNNYTGYQADMFAIGVIIFIMHKGTPPFLSTKQNDKIYKLIKQKKWMRFWQLHEKDLGEGFFSMSFKSLMNSFFSLEVNMRPTFESLASDEWLNGPSFNQQQIFDDMRPRLDGLDPFLLQVYQLHNQQ